MNALDRIGDALELLMKRRAINQKDLALVADMPPPQLNRYLRGVKTPQLPVLQRLLEALGADLHELADALEQVGGRRPADLADLAPPPEEENAPTPSASPLATREEAEEIRRRLREGAEKRVPGGSSGDGLGAGDPTTGDRGGGVSETEFRSLLRRMIEDAVAAQKRIDEAKEDLPLGTDGGNDDLGSAK